MSKRTDETSEQMPSWREAFLYFLFLGFVSVGGPFAQITMMFNHMVERRRWLSKDRFVKIKAFCHMLPGPGALQLAIYVGYLKRRFWGGIVAGLTFVLPGAAVMIVLSWLTHYVEKVRDNKPVQAFLAGVSAGVVGVIAVVSLELIPEALVGWPSVAIFLSAFLFIVWLKLDVALVAIGAIVAGILYSLMRAYF